MNLLVVESPAKAKTINKYLGSDFEVIATVGHFRDLAKRMVFKSARIKMISL